MNIEKIFDRIGTRAGSSGRLERHADNVEVRSSNLLSPTKINGE